MGPIRGFRVINLRVTEDGLDKVAYPDLTVGTGHGDGDHVVIGLENGGGKGTLLGFLFHVLLPGQRLFLPRRAQRRQQRRGGERRIEQYVPGGGTPTHVVIELDLPARDRRHPGQAGRVLAGACLYKTDGPEPFREFFWSARCVTGDLTLAGLGVRGDGGRLLDHREWRARLEELKKTVPDAEIAVCTTDRDWTGHLSGTLKIDTEFIRTWLLAMNEDEGAADHVFTYGSSRAFLDTLVRAVAPPEDVDDINKNLTAMAGDADKIRTDRHRETLLRRLVACTGPLAGHMETHTALDAARHSMAAALLITGARIRGTRRFADAALGQAAAREQDTADAVTAATTEETRAAALEILARLQEARLLQEDADTAVTRQQDAVNAAAARSRALACAAILARHRAAAARTGDIRDLLAERQQDAEPARQAASSALQAWHARLSTDLAAVTARITEARDEAGAAQDAEDQHAGELRDAASALTAAVTETASVTAELNRITALEDDARDRGDLPAGQTPAQARETAADRAEDLARQADQAHTARRDRQKALDRIATETAELSSRETAADTELKAAQEHADQIRAENQALAADLTGSGLLDLDDDFHLADYAAIIADTLAQAAVSAAGRQVDAAVKAAAASRAVRSLETTGLLPARPDVTALCEHAARYGARPGWSYLAALPPETAARYARQAPGLADGIVVNVPDDFPRVVEIARARHAELHGPVIIGSPAAFETPAPGGNTETILPAEGFWSPAAAAAETGPRTAACARHQQAADSEAARHDTATILHGRVTRWLDADGPGTETAAAARLDAARETARQLPAEREALDARRRQAEQDRDTAETAEKDLRAAATAAADLTGRLAILEQQAAPRGELDARLARLRDAARTAETAQAQAEQAARAARARRTAAAGRATSLTAEHTRIAADLSAAEADTAAVCLPGDPVTPADQQADRDLLADRARTLTGRWKGAISDDRLEGELSELQKQLRDTEREAGRYQPSTRDAARALLGDDPGRSAADFQHDADTENNTQARLAQELGGLQHDASQRADAVTSLEDALARQHAETITLPPEHSASSLPAARAAREHLENAHRSAQAKTARAARAHDAARTETATLAGWKTLLTQADEKLLATLDRITVAGKLAERIDTFHGDFDQPETSMPPDAPESLITLAGTLGGTAPPAPEDRDRLLALADDVNAEALHLHNRLDDTGDHATRELENIRVILQNAGDEITAGDKLIQTLRDLRPSDLAASASRYHEAAEARLIAVSHYIAKFDSRLEATAQLTSAHIHHLIRAVRHTVTASQLPATPALGRWGGLPLLKITGLDKLTIAQREAAILATLQHWFDPDHPADRPDFDADQAVNALLAAAVPHVTATVLIPSDPLSAQHKPVEALAVTSGGEGVTVALILASLIASRRARELGHDRTTLLLDNPFAKVNKPMFLRLARDVSRSLGVQLIPLTGIRDLGALTVFPGLIQLRVSRRETANAVIPAALDDDRAQELLRDGTLYASPDEVHAAEAEAAGDEHAWPVMSRATVYWQPGLLGPSEDEGADGTGGTPASGNPGPGNDDETAADSTGETAP